ncbi:hypothetical protein [Micromonospora chalcea]
MESEAELLARVGAWAGEQLLGTAVGDAVAAAAPVTVRVRVADSAGWLRVLPWELAYAGGVALARRGDVSLVFDVDGSAAAPGGVGRPAGGVLRVVGVFSQPTATTALGLRRERYELARLVRGLAARSRRMVQLEVLQYGVTRQVLADRIAAGGGPDVLHLSGHGGSGLVLLETLDGGSDEVDAGELVGMLRPARGRLRLAVLSACQSAAATTAETLRMLGLVEQAEQAQQAADQEDAFGGDTRPAGEPVLAGVAGQVARQIGCAVVAMRYPVSDEFAIALAGSLYEGLFALDLPVDAAVRRAVPRAAGPVASAAFPAVSIATPTVFGTTAVGMTLQPPRGRPVVDPAEQRMAAFPDEPPRFVGRTAAMIRASRALAPGSGWVGVLFHGMAGAGKTACAVELAYRHQDRFALPVWWQAPQREEEWPGALTDFALAMERQLGEYGFTMIDKIATVEGLRRFLPRLTELLEHEGLLLVLDNLETLLTEDGQWRDPRWADLMTGLTGHTGESRVVLTSRIAPAGLNRRMLVEPVHALSRDETALLARDLPNLRRLLHADPGPTRQPAPTVDADRATVRRVLHLVQGHPKLLELADAAAGDPHVLAAQLGAAEQAATGQPMTAFFTTGATRLDTTGFLHVLAEWTTTRMRTLPEPSRLLLQLITGVEDDDRWSYVLDDNWADLCRRLGIGDPPDLTTSLAPLTAAALVHTDTPDGEPTAEDQPPPVRYRVHPGVAEAVRAATPEHVRTAIDTELGAYWQAVANWARRREGAEATQAIVRAGLSAAPYLLRQQQWDDAARLLDLALHRDRTAGVAQVAAGYLRRIAEATGDPSNLGVLGRATARVDPAEAERLLHAALAQATTNRDSRLASAIAGELMNLLRNAGRLREALALADQMVELTRQAGLGPWTQLSNEAQRMQLLYLLGEPEQVLTKVHQLLDRMDHLPDQPGDNENTTPWNARESVLNLGVHGARAMRRWQDALDFNTQLVASQQQRGAGDHTIAHTRFVDYAPLLQLGRIDDAEQLLLSSQQVFEDHNDIQSLGKTLGARALLADERGRCGDATALEHTALRLKYTRPDPDAIATSHHNLANYLRRAAGDPAGRLAHRLAAAILRQVTGQTHDLAITVRALAAELRGLPDVAPPAIITEVAALVEQVDGVRFTGLVTDLAGDLDAAQHALTTVLHAARDLPTEALFDLQSHLDQWEPTLVALVAAAAGDPTATAAIDRRLTNLADTTDWAALAAALRRILAGEHDPDQLLPGLDPIDTAIVTRALDALAGRITLTPAPSPDDQTQARAELAQAVIAAARGDRNAADAVAPILDQMTNTPAWAALAAALRHILAGQRDPDQLLPGLDPTDTAITQAVLAALTNPPQEPTP